MAQVNFQLTGADSPIETMTLPPVVFRLFSGGPQLCPKFRAASVNLIVNENINMTWIELLQAVRKVYTETENVLAKGKGGRGSVQLSIDLVKPLLDGSYVSPFDTIAEVIKVIEEALKATNNGELFSLWINFGAHKYWNKEASKYDFENFKKPSDPEEVEDLIAKLLLDKKTIKVIEDPFILEHKASWHRLNVGHCSLVQT